MELTLFAFLEPDGDFQVFREIRLPYWVLNSVYIMDHDSEGRCYCGGYFYSKYRTC